MQTKINNLEYMRIEKINYGVYENRDFIGQAGGHRHT